MYKLREIEKVCHTRIEERRVPSAKEITRAKSQKVFAEVIDIIENSDITSALEFVNQKVEEGEYTAEQLAAGFMKLKMGADIEDLVLFEKRSDRRDGYGRRGRGDSRGSYSRSRDGKSGDRRRSYKGDRKYDDRKPGDRRSGGKRNDERSRDGRKSDDRRKAEDRKRKPRKQASEGFENVGRINIKGEGSTKAWYLDSNDNKRSNKKSEDTNTMNVSKTDKKKIKSDNKKRSLDYLQDVSDLVMESFGKRKNNK